MSASRRAGGPLRIVVDTLSIQPNAGGIRVHLRELLRHFPGAATDCTLICSRSNVAAFADLPVQIVIVPWPTRSRVLRVLTQQLLLPLLLLRLRPQLLFAPVDIAPLLAPVPIVTCLHSSHLNAQAGFSGGLQNAYNRLFVPATMRRSRRLIAISGFVADESLRMQPAAAGKLVVVYHGGGLIERARSAGWSPPPDALRNGDVLFIGTLHPHKRADALLRAYALLCEQHAGRELPGLVLAGHDATGLTPSLQALSRELNIADRVRFLGRVSDAQLMELYSCSRVLVVPSVVEGFGLPVVEAMQAGLPVIVSDRCALPEIAGDAGFVANPDDTAALATAMGTALWDAQQRTGMIARGLRRGETFTWHNCADQTLKVFAEALSSAEVHA